VISESDKQELLDVWSFLEADEQRLALDVFPELRQGIRGLRCQQLQT
jgi:hypothetical protein